MEVDDGKSGRKGRHGEGRGDRDEGDGPAFQVQGVLYQVRDAPGAEDNRRVFFSFPHDAADLLQALVGGMELPGGQDKGGGEVRPAERDACLAQQGPELFVDLRRRTFGAFLGEAVHKDANSAVLRQACPVPAE